MGIVLVTLQVSPLIGNEVVELFHRDLSVSVVVESLHQGVLFVVGDEDVHASKSCSKFLEANDSVVVLVEVLNQINHVLLQGAGFLGLNLQFVNDLVNAGAWELVRVVLHVFFGVLVSLEQLELESAEEDALANQEVFLFVVSVAHWALVLLSLHELSSNSSRVLVAHFIDLDGVISAVE